MQFAHRPSPWTGVLSPALTDAARPATFNVAAVDEKGEVREVPVAGEHPLTLYVDKQELLTLMTLGGAPEALAIGYLRNQRLVDSIDDIVSVQVDWECNACAITTRHGLADLEAKTAKRTKTTGCGQGTVFGDLMDEIDSVRLPTGAHASQATLYDLLDRVRLHETIYKQAGAVHGCALATNDGAACTILMFVEDVGRHNAVDAIAGRMWLDGLDGGDKIFYTTGRLTSEMVIKAAQMGIPFLVSRSGLTQMGYEIAQKVGLTMIGRAMNKHYLLFTGAERFAAMPERKAGARAVPLRPRAVRRAVPVALQRALPLRELPARARRGLRDVGRLSSRAGAGHAAARTFSSRTSRRRSVPALLRPLRHQALLRVRQVAGRDACRARRVRRAGRPAARRARFYAEHASWLPCRLPEPHCMIAAARRHRHRAGRRHGPAHGPGRQGPRDAGRAADGGARARAPGAAGRRDRDQREPEPASATRRLGLPVVADEWAASPARSRDCTRA